MQVEELLHLADGDHGRHMGPWVYIYCVNQDAFDLKWQITKLKQAIWMFTFYLTRILEVGSPRFVLVTQNVILQFCCSTILSVWITTPFLVARWWLQSQRQVSVWRYSKQKVGMKANKQTKDLSLHTSLIIKEKYFPEAPFGKFSLHFLFQK